MTLAIVTATTQLARAAECLRSWGATASSVPALITVHNGEKGGYLGSVPAFRQGVDRALLETDAEIIACFHDDFEILETDWDLKVLRAFAKTPRMGLAGFGGAIGLGSEDLYQTPYDPLQLARQGFRSNLVDAEQHGVRSLLAERVACLDGFSQIGRRQFWEGYPSSQTSSTSTRQPTRVPHGLPGDRPWTYLEQLGVRHHLYDGLLGCLAARYGWETWYLPVRGKHYGGRTAVGDPGYQQWAQTQVADGDQGFWKEAHRIGYDAFRDVLPLRV